MLRDLFTLLQLPSTNLLSLMRSRPKHRSLWLLLDLMNHKLLVGQLQEGMQG